ncbi:hypothetical protein FCL40_17025 [Ferrimonas sediminicola]|uniref:Lipoprotein n=1 Tax=Ferrimonas sediminicola TaxID=2569538 RepID=A0A4U1B967_9GAMM|nr:hypothetical protein [Ferrimonas sediminicola]TKB46876.1 hypothetical protein FCL40_17025 [Ferrimonas sediminicola]
MNRLVGAMLLTGLLAGCASNQEFACGVVSSGARPPAEQGLFQVLVTHIDGQPVVSKASYRLSPGRHDLRLVELIDDPRLGVNLRARSYRELTLQLQPDQELLLAARFDLQGQKPDGGRYWEPVIWQRRQHSCSLEP